MGDFDEYVDDTGILRWIPSIFHTVWWKISIFHECVARVKMLMFSPHCMKNIWYLPIKSKFSFYFMLQGELQKAKPNFFLGRFSSDLTFVVCFYF